MCFIKRGTLSVFRGRKIHLLRDIAPRISTIRSNATKKDSTNCFQKISSAIVAYCACILLDYHLVVQFITFPLFIAILWIFRDQLLREREPRNARQELSCIYTTSQLYKRGHACIKCIVPVHRATKITHIRQISHKYKYLYQNLYLKNNKRTCS